MPSAQPGAESAAPDGRVQIRARRVYDAATTDDKGAVYRRQFAQRFKDTSKTTVAFGANLLGAMVGGVVEYAAIAVGYQALLVVVAAFYALAFVLERRLGLGGTEAMTSPT